MGHDSRFSDTYNAGLSAFYGLVGVLQGVIGGLYYAVVISLREPERRWLTRDWVLNGIIATVPLGLILMIASMGKATIGWDVWIIPAQTLLSSYLTVVLVKKQIEIA
jgi:H+/Cl- antiporter ClcA